MKPKVFIDGAVGTTGLQIGARLAERDDLELLRLPEEERKDSAARARALNDADLVILCLPDDAAREAVRLIDDPAVRVIDASTAHRTHTDWVYGIPEMSAGQTERIAAATRVSNPGCYPTGFISLIRPLVDAGLIPRDYPTSCNAVSGYSGGGNKLIARFESTEVPSPIESQIYAYGLTLEHKHVEEMRVHGLLSQRPLFAPSVGHYYQGMLVQVPLQLWSLPKQPSPGDLYEVLAETYGEQQFVTVADPAETAALERLDPEALNGSNQMTLYVFGNEDRKQVLLAAVLDNLGKGASGAAVQNMNLMLGLDPAAGLGGRLAA